MNPEPLRTYLRTHRRRTCLSQDEVAFLLGSMCGTIVSRHEQGARLPMLETVLAYAFIFQTDVPGLYEGVFQEIQKKVRTRAKGLCRSLERRPKGSRRDHKIAHLKTLLNDEREN